MRQCSMSRTVKFSSNWNKAQARVQKIHNGFACTRKDFLHKTTTTISPNHALACIEDLRVRNMSRHSKLSKGNSEPRPAVEAKVGPKPPPCFFDQGWGEFRDEYRRELDDKLSWNGVMSRAVAPHNTSLTCPRCAHVSKDNRLTQAIFLCVDCGYENHADVCAINVLERGQRLLACAETVKSGRSKKQEPTEVTRKSSPSALRILVH